MLHIKCGDGVGKTTSAVGQAVRMLGYNKKVIFVQFMKDGLSGEINFLKNNSNIYVLHPTGPIKFIWNMTDSEKSDLKDIHTNLIKETEKILKSEHISMVIFDEFNSANELNLLDKDYAYKIICEYKDKTEIILSEVLQRRKIGERLEVYVPWKYGYGSSDYTPKGSSITILGYSTLVFDIQMLKCEK